MQTLELSTFLAGNDDSKTSRGSDMGTVTVEACRNKGARRTPRKVAMLDRAEARANAAGKAFPKSYR